MPGIRLHHRSLTNVVFTVENPLRAYREPYMCPTCGLQHGVKTYHLNLDSEGDVIVSETVLERLREIPFVLDHELEVANEVKKPPKISLNLADGQKTFRLFQYQPKVTRKNSNRRKKGST